MRSTAIAVGANLLAFAAAVAVARWNLWVGVLGGAAAIAASTAWATSSEGRVRRAVASAAHELRNCLGVIRGAVELVSGRADSRLTPPEQRFLQDALRNVDAMKLLVVDLASAAVEPPVAIRTVDLRSELELAVRDALATFPRAAVTLSGGEGILVAVDPLRLRQILSNLLANALGLDAPGRVEIEASDAGGFARIRVRDEGPGIPPELQPRLFQPFVTSKASHGGSGLGLAVSRRLAERMGGSLELESTSAGATVFALRLRRADATAARPGPPSR